MSPTRWWLPNRCRNADSRRLRMVRTLASRLSSWMIRCTSSAAAQATGMSLVGLAVQEAAVAIGERMDDAAGDQDSADRLIAVTQAIRDDLDIGVTPSCSQACTVPVRPTPHITSSRISVATRPNGLANEPSGARGQGRIPRRGRLIPHHGNGSITSCTGCIGGGSVRPRMPDAARSAPSCVTAASDV